LDQTKTDSMKTIGIIGSRRRNENSDLRSCIEVFKTVYKKGDKIVSGGCPQGGDRFAEVIAEHLGLTVENGYLILHEANWKKYGRGAGFQRNGYIAEDSDVLIAVVSPDRTGGTEDTITKAQKLGKRIVLVTDEKQEIEKLADIIAESV